VIKVRLLAAAMVLFVWASHSSAAPVDQQTSEARRHYEAGLAHFNLREYADAIREFEAGYRLRPDPVFLFNLAQANRLGDRPDKALYFYRAYLRSSPDAQNRSEVVDRIESLEKLLAEKRNVAKPPDQTLAPEIAKGTAQPFQADPAKTAFTSRPVDAPHHHVPVYKRWWFWTIGAVVVAGVAVGVGVGVASNREATFNANVGTFGPAALGVRF
jgi:hypothetical protein